MARKGFKVLDSDMHIIEPPDLWQRYIDPEFKDQAPRGLTETVGDLRMIGPDGKPWGRDAGSCTSSVRVNTRGLPGDRHKGKNAEMRGRSWHLSGPLTPGDAFDAGLRTHVAGSGPLPLLLPTTPVDSYPRQLRPGWHTKQQHFAQRPDMVGQPRRHGG